MDQKKRRTRKKTRKQKKDLSAQYRYTLIKDGYSWIVSITYPRRQIIGRFSSKVHAMNGMKEHAAHQRDKEVHGCRP